VLNGTFVCSAATFGSDPNPGKKVKECSVELDPEGETPAPVQPPTVPSPTTPTPVVPSPDAPSPTLPPSSPLPPSPAEECRAGATIRNKTVDCGGKTLGLSCDADNESQPPVLTLINATVKNLRIAAGGGSDGIHCNGGDCLLENVVWEDICEDAATHKSEGGTLTIKGGSVYNDTTGPGGKPDKIFQHNSKNSTTIITGGFTVKGQNGKLWRSCGDCKDNGGPRLVIIDDVIIEGTITAGLVGVNSNYGDTAKIRHLKVKNYRAGKPRICNEYTGVNKGQGSSTKRGEFFESPACDVSPTDVTSF
ncbi:MAG: pectate lyase, partial [Pseudobdellovibrionaceae bacterium]|nr:pectate lyase [Pseudobdellovibrionaceae bacterium]